MSQPMWFDSHCHLYSIEEEPEAVLGRARSAGVTDVLVLGVDPATSRQAIELASSSGVWAGAAFHPSETKGWRDEAVAAIDELLEDPRTVAVGETGLDRYWDDSFLDDQLRAFVAHIDLAKKHDKALVIHTRDSIDDAIDTLRGEGPPARLVFHCWSGDASQARHALALGAYISFAGNVSFRNAADLRSVATTIPSDRLLVETDSPYLAPVPHRGSTNEPAYVVHVGDALASCRDEDPAEVARNTSDNARRLFGLDG